MRRPQDLQAPALARPSPSDLRQATARTIPDVIAPDLDVLFCRINPGLYSGAMGLHFARPGNRFWPALAASGFTATRTTIPGSSARCSRAASASPTSWRARRRRPRNWMMTNSGPDFARSRAKCGAIARARSPSSASARIARRSIGPMHDFGRQPETLGRCVAVGAAEHERPERALSGSRLRERVHGTAAGATQEGKGEKT